MIIVKSFVELPNSPELDGPDIGFHLGPISLTTDGVDSSEVILFAAGEFGKQGFVPLSIPIIYGMIRYRHLLDRADHLTTFGYWIDHQERVQMLPASYAAYNDHT